MSYVYSLLEEKGLITSAQVEAAFRRWTPDESGELRNALWNALQADKAKAREPSTDLTQGEFRFFASSSIRGDYGCGQWGCRAAKAASLARYAALYCESVIVPVSMNMHGDPKADNLAVRDNLAGTILCLQEFRPAAESGIVRLVPDEIWLCSQCAREGSENFTNTAEAAREFLLRNVDKFSVEYLPTNPDNPLSHLEVTGPDEYLEHGRIIVVYLKDPEWLQAIRQSTAAKRYRLNVTEVEKSGVVKTLLSRLAGDTTMQQFYGIRYGAKCLTNLVGQVQVLSALNDDQYMAHCTSGLLASLTHSVPILDELPTATVVRIRKEEADAFLRYRIALGKIVKEYVKTKKHVGPSEAREIYSDLLLPEILRLRAETKNHRNSRIAPALKKCGFSAMAVTLGLFGGVPGHVAAALKVAGGTNLLRDLHDAFSEREKAPSEVRNDNFYFLLRVLDEIE